MNRGQNRGGKAPVPLLRKEGHWAYCKGKPSCLCGWARPGKTSTGYPFSKPVLRQTSPIHPSKLHPTLLNPPMTPDIFLNSKTKILPS